MTPKIDAAEALRAVLQELQGVRVELSELREQHAGIQRQLEAPQEDAPEVAELRRMNAYLLGELHRRATIAAPPRRPWWRWWGRQ